MLVQGRILSDEGGGHALPADVVGNAEDRGLAHSRTGIDDAFHHLRIDIVAVGDDELIASADQGEKAAGVDLPEITGVEPTPPPQPPSPKRRGGSRTGATSPLRLGEGAGGRGVVERFASGL